MSSLIAEILRENGIHVHSVTSRVKDRQSLAKKLSRPDCPYSSLSDVTDIAGVRITTYLEDDVSKVAKLLEEEFKVDHQNSGDKGALLDPDQLRVLVSASRCELVARALPVGRVPAVSTHEGRGTGHVQFFSMLGLR